MLTEVIVIISMVIFTIILVKYIEYREYIENYKHILVQGHTINETCKYLLLGDAKRYMIKKVKILENYEVEHYLASMLRDVQKHGGWDLDRHDNYPTTDKEVTGDWETFPAIKELFHTKIKPILSKLFKIRDTNLINITEIFFVKYEYAKNTQKSLEPHKDGSEMSFIIALSDDYTDGGTNFVITDKTVKLKKGEGLFFSGKEYHQGLPITSGLRYILTGFIAYNAHEFCDNVLIQQNKINRFLINQ